MQNRLVARFAVRETLGVLILGAALFLSAGEVTWPAAWALLGLTALWTLATGVVIVRTNPALLAERLGPRKGAKAWDTRIMSLYGVQNLAMLVVAGLDRRFGWTGGVGLTLTLVAFLICAAGYALVVWATASNAYFSQLVRVQEERGHSVETGGPYRYLRHPGYAGSILTAVGAPVLLGSLWALALGLVGAVLLVLRTSLEDRTLLAELPGYQAYAAGVRKRLMPGVW